MMKLALVRVISIAPVIVFTSLACGPELIGEEATTEDAVIPPGYYNTVDLTNATTLRSTLHAVIDDHTRYPYTSSNTDTWDILEAADQDPNNSSRVLDLYKNASYQKFGGGNTFYSREHSWPTSYGFSSSGSSPYTDCHHLFISDYAYNSTRGNKPYTTCTGCNEVTTVVNNGQGGAGQSNWTVGSSSSGLWETWIGRRGDVARAILYMDVRYEGGTHGGTGASEPNLQVTDNASLIVAGGTYMGMLSDLLRWNIDDPPSDHERNRLEVVFSYQGNRNPFVDNYNWAGCLFRGACPSSALPTAPASLVGSTDDVTISLDWSDNGESIMVGYRIYRATSAGGPYTRLNNMLHLSSNYQDTNVVSGTRYYYRVVVVDAADRESSPSEVNVWPGAPQALDVVFINELHYDNDGTDSGEGFEIAAPAGTNLEGWKVIGYNGSNNGQYATINLTGIVPSQANCYGTLSFTMVGMQNGSPDALALIDPSNNVVEFLSYEGGMSAVDGLAAGHTATDIGVSETATTPVGHSLRRIGTGTHGSDFTFATAAASSFGSINAGQTFSTCN
jgi:endonuclease I